MTRTTGLCSFLLALVLLASLVLLWAVGKGVTTGTGTTSFSPEKTCTRGQIVTFLYRDLA